MKKFLVLLFFPLFFSGCAVSETNASNEIMKELRAVGSVIALIEREYVEPVPMKTLIRGALRGIMRTLDPYSQFLNEQQYQDLKLDTEGQFAGVGIEVSIKGGLLHLIAPLDGSPAALAGMRPGDTILKINDESTREMSLAEAVDKMRGAAGTPVKLTVMREGVSQIIEFPLTRQIVKIQSVRDVKMIEPGIGYIRLSAFQENTLEDFEIALRKMEHENAKSLILDIRNNAGGLLSSGVRVAATFIPKGQLVVSTKSRSGKQDKNYLSDTEMPFSFKPLILLVNKGSASSSEVLAGAIQDYGLGKIVGTQTFGKGSVQSLVPLPDGTALRLTTSRYYTPKGRLIHEIGITPDVLVEAAREEAGKDLILEKAVEIAKG